MKKKFYLICLSLVFLTMFYSCEKDPSGNGSLIITVYYHNQPVAGAKVYLKMGVYTNPNFTDNQYDDILTANGGGVATFSNLTPGRYYIKTIGYTNQTTVQGDSTATVVRRYRGDNISNFTINVQ
jgi:hypothetical protein